MNNKLNNKELADLLALKAQISESEAELFLKELFKLVTETISETELVKIKDFGTFKLTRVQARESVDVNTGEKIEISSHLKVSFLPAPVLKDLVNKPFSHFETTLLNGDTSFSEISESDEKENDEEDTATDNFQSEIIESVEIVGSTDSSEIIEDENAASSETIETTEISENINAAVKLDATENLNKTSLIPKSKRTEVWIPILGSVVVIGALFFFFTQGSRKTRTIENNLHESSLVQIASKSNLTDTVGTNVETTKVISLTSTSNIAENVMLEAGKTLRLIALDKFGNRDFWIYIYLTNKDKIKNPDVVPVGTELIIPDTIEFDINSKNPSSVSKAKKLGDITMKNLSNY